VQGVLTGFATIGTVITLGWVLGRRGVFGPDATAVLSRLTFLVATPALLLTTLADSDVGAVFSSALAVTAGSVLGVATVSVLVTGLLWRRSLADIAVGALSATYVNAGNLGIPVAAYVLGDAAFLAPVLLLQLLVMAPLGLAVLATGSGSRRSWRTIVTQPFRTPITLACGAGLAMSAWGLELPELAAAPVELLGATAVPAALLAYGLSLHGAARPGSGATRRDVWLVVLLKNVVHPLLAYSLARWAVGLDGLTLLAVTVTAALPTANNVFVYASAYGRSTTLARDGILLTTLLSVPVLLVVVALSR
jgi:malonate transporter